MKGGISSERASKFTFPSSCMTHRSLVEAYSIKKADLICILLTHCIPGVVSQICTALFGGSCSLLFHECDHEHLVLPAWQSESHDSLHKFLLPASIMKQLQSIHIFCSCCVCQRLIVPQEMIDSQVLMISMVTVSMAHLTRRPFCSKRCRYKCSRHIVLRVGGRHMVMTLC